MIAVRTRRIGVWLLLGAALLWTCAPAPASDRPPSEPMLRIETGMHTARISKIAYDARRHYLVTASTDKTLRVWELSSHRLLSTLRPPIAPGEEGKLYAVAMSSDGDIIATAGITGPEWDQSASIYIFRRADSKLIGRITGLPHSITDLAFTHDRKYLVATLHGTNGVGVFRMLDYALVGLDRNYGDSSNKVDIDRRNRVVTSSLDGYVRLYQLSDLGLRLLAKHRTNGGNHPFGVRFSPDGSKIAVGFHDAIRVDVLSAESLDPLYTPDLTGMEADIGNLMTVAWSSDGRNLYAGGVRWDKNLQMCPIRKWAEAGRGQHNDYGVSRNSILSILPLLSSGFVFASAAPSWGIFSESESQVLEVSSVTADLRRMRDYFAISQNGSVFQFQYDQVSKENVPSLTTSWFDIGKRKLKFSSVRSDLSGPSEHTGDISVTDWNNKKNPKLNGRSLELDPHEVSRSVAIAPTGDVIALGAEWTLRLFDQKGNSKRTIAAPGVVWSVNIPRNGKIVVAAHGDGTIRWYRLSDGKELLAFFPHADRKRWVLWTPSGYYDASPGGEDLIGWHVNRGKDEAADFFPASRFRDRFYRPDIISKILETYDEAEAVALANREAGRQAERASILKTLPPVVELLSPGDGAEISQDTVTLRYRVRTAPDAPVLEEFAQVNGQYVPKSRNLAIRSKDEVRTMTLPLSARDSEVSLFARNKHGISVPAVVRLTWAGASRPAPDIKPKLYVLAVGVSTYRNPDNNLNFPAKDATDFVKTLERQKGGLYRDVEAKLLTNGEATRANVRAALEWFRGAVGADDVGILFLAGHGLDDARQRYYFIPHDGDAKALDRTAVADDEIMETFRLLAGQRKIFFVDTCRSGTAFKSGSRTRAGNVTTLINKMISAEARGLVYAASRGNEDSLEHPDWGNGAFTRAVLEGLQGKAANEARLVKSKKLDSYIAERVEALTRGRQSPVTEPGGVPNFDIAIVR